MKQEILFSSTGENENCKIQRNDKIDSLVKSSPYKQYRIAESPNFDYSNLKSPNVDHLYSNLIKGQRLMFPESPSQTFHNSQNHFFKNQGFYSNSHNLNHMNNTEEVVVKRLDFDKENSALFLGKPAIKVTKSSKYFKEIEGKFSNFTSERGINDFMNRRHRIKSTFMVKDVPQYIIEEFSDEFRNDFNIHFKKSLKDEEHLENLLEHRKVKTAVKIRPKTLFTELKLNSDEASADDHLHGIKNKKGTSHCETKETLETKIKCKCKKSQCLKLYCECFQKLGYCEDCDCVNCCNVPGNEKREDAIEQMKLKNSTFKQKQAMQENSKQVSIGCNCSKSFCVKKYCECFNKGLGCNDQCRCVNCKNKDNSVFSKMNRQNLKKNETANNAEGNMISSSYSRRVVPKLTVNENSCMSFRSSEFQIEKTSICVDSKKINIIHYDSQNVATFQEVENKEEENARMNTRNRAKKQKEKEKNPSCKLSKTEEKFVSPKNKTPSLTLGSASQNRLSPYSSLKQTADRTAVLKVKRNRKVDLSKEDHGIRKNLYKMHYCEKEKV